VVVCHPEPLPGYFRREAGRGLLKDKFILRESSVGSFLAEDLIKNLDERTTVLSGGRLKSPWGLFLKKFLL